MCDSQLGIVVIGRNEGDRLRLCLESIVGFGLPLVYVDSNSTDTSVSLASSMGVKVHQLDSSQPCSAARARREGFRQLLGEYPNLLFVFFVDGDCQVGLSWPQVALNFLLKNDKTAAVCGRRREQHPEHSVYNRLCDHEWATPIGAAMSVGGDAVYRCSAYREVGEFNASVPAGEEPELCKRLRDRGWVIYRIKAEMTVHNAAITHFYQWWKRQFRTGYAGYDVERRFRLGIFNRINKSALFWGLAFPLLVTHLALFLGLVLAPKWAMICLAAGTLLVVLQVSRMVFRAKSTGNNLRHSLEIGFFTMASKVPIAQGVVKQLITTARGQKSTLIEYKSAKA